MYDYPNRCGKVHFDKIQHSFTLEQRGCQQAFSVEGQAVELGLVGWPPSCDYSELPPCVKAAQSVWVGLRSCTVLPAPGIGKLPQSETSHKPRKPHA